MGLIIVISVIVISVLCMLAIAIAQSEHYFAYGCNKMERFLNKVIWAIE